MILKNQLRIQIITPSFYLDTGKLLKSRQRWIHGITMPYLAALIPGNNNGEVYIKITDDGTDEID